MVMYTQLVLGVDLVKDVPEEVVRILKYMCGQKEDQFETLPDHPLFKCKGWSYILNYTSSYFQGNTDSKVYYHNYYGENYYSLNVRCNFKNYEDELEHFLNWLSPYVKTTDKVIGYSLHETERLPTWIKL